jgi:hypothetical protein
MRERSLRRDGRSTEVPSTLWRHRVVAPAAPGMATAYSAETKPRSAPDSMRLQGLEKIDGARRFKPAAATRPLEKRQNRREQNLVTANKKTREQEHQGARIEARSARRNHSSFSSACVARAAAARATITNQKPGRTLSCSFRTISRNRRRSRFRTTAPPIRFEVTKPTRKRLSSFLANTPRTSRRPPCAVPSDLTRPNSTGSVSLFVFGNERRAEGVPDCITQHNTAWKIMEPARARAGGGSRGCPPNGPATAGAGRLQLISVQQKASRGRTTGSLS